MSGMEALVDAGKIRFIGVSNFSVRDLIAAQAVLTNQLIVANQVRYSLVERTVERDLLPYCRQHAITVIAYSPLARGLANIRGFDPEAVLPRVAKALSRTEAQVALNWCIRDPNVIAIPKASTTAHALEDGGASGWTLPAELASLLARKIRYTSRGPLETSARRTIRWAMQMLGRWL